MNTNHDEQQAGREVQEPEGSGIEASRRRFLQFSAATSAAAVSGLVSSAAYADDTLAMAGGPGVRPSWAPTKYLVDCHFHLGSGPTVAELAPTIHSPADWGALRTAQPEKFAQMTSEDAVDDSAILLDAMDRYGVTHAVIQTAPGKGTNNQMVLDAAAASNGRLIPSYRPEAISNAAARGTLGVDYGGELSEVVRQIADELQSPAMSATRGVGEVVPITTELHPAKIVRDMAPIMEVLQARGDLPIIFPTGYTGWKGVHYYVFSPIWADEVAGAFPTVPIVLGKMGRGYPGVLRCLPVRGDAQRQRLFRHDRYRAGAPPQGNLCHRRATDHVRQRHQRHLGELFDIGQSQNRRGGAAVRRGA